MAFGDLAVHMIIFIAVVSLATGVVFAMKGYVDASTSSLARQQDRISNQIETEIVIEVISYVNETEGNFTYVYVKNTGNTRIDLDLVDVFIDHLRIPRQKNNRTIEVMSDTDTINTGIWDPGEGVLIKINQTITGSDSHVIRITTDNAIVAEDKFTVE